jgi:hypothetical protein
MFLVFFVLPRKANTFLAQGLRGKHLVEMKQAILKIWREKKCLLQIVVPKT